MGVADMESTSMCGAHLLEALFVADAEALLFVDDEEAEVLELEVFGEDAVGADEDVDFALFGFFEDDLLLLWRCGSGRSSRR